MAYELTTVPNWTYYQQPQPQIDPAKLGLFARLANKFGDGKTLGPNLFGKGLGLEGIKNASSNFRNTNLLGLGKIGTLANIGIGAKEGVEAISNINNLSNTDSDLEDLIARTNVSAMGNPMYASYLTGDQKNMLRKVQRGDYGSGTGLEGALEGAGKSLPSTALKTLAAGLIGGPVGAAIAAIGGLGNAALKGADQAKQRKASELSTLYETLTDAEQDYNSMRRPANLDRAGLQRRYYNQLM